LITDLKKLDYMIIPFRFFNGKNFLTNAFISARVMWNFLFKITQLTDGMSTKNLSLTPTFFFNWIYVR